MSNFIINREGDYKNETISSIPLGNNNFSIDYDNNFNLKKDDISNSKPMLSSNRITIPDGKKVKIKPILNKNVPVNTFSAMANPKKNMSSNNSNSGSSQYSEEEESYEDESDDILSSNSKTNYKIENKYENDQEDDDEEDDYSSVESDRKNKGNRNHQSSDYTEEDDDEEDEEDDDEEEEEPVKQKTYEEIQQEKQELLFNLERLQKQGYPPSKKYSMASSYEDIKYEYDRLKRQRDVEKSIRFSRKALMAVVSGAEFLNNRFDYFDIKLNGWSENVMENVSDYDEVFEELHDKYSESVKMAPELKLLGLVGSSALMFHITNSIFKQASPKLSDILKNNPDIMKNVTEAAMKNVNSTINQEFGENDMMGNMMKNGMNAKLNQQRPGPGPTRNQPKMNGPPGIDELLNELNGGDDASSVSSSGSINIKSSAKRTIGGKGRNGGVTLNL